MSPSQPPSRLPRIAITVGDVAGVGPELALRCAADRELCRRCQPVVIGPADVLRRVAEQLDLPLPMLRTMPQHFGVMLLSNRNLPNTALGPPPLGQQESGFSGQPGWSGDAALGMASDQAETTVVAELVDLGEISAADVRPGHFSRASGAASFAAVDYAIAAALAGDVAAIVTGPIQKEAWHAADVPFAGHTELLAARTGAKDVRMMLTSEAISCVLVTIHIPLADVPRSLSAADILRTIELAAEAVSGPGRRSARVTVCGLNPHAGENGLIGHGEEEAMIVPAIESARQAGFDVRGPLPPDTAFTPNWRAQTDVYVCMYHDQGLIPLKALAFDDAVNVTLGLPIVRTSVDHGTALDLAWQGTASDSSMRAAIDLAIQLAR